MINLFFLPCGICIVFKAVNIKIPHLNVYRAHTAQDIRDEILTAVKMYKLKMAVFLLATVRTSNPTKMYVYVGRLSFDAV
jgi:hypothetical protein